jgi:curved DNA-binding protein CbpA
VLHVSRDDLTKRVYFKNGDIIFASSSADEDRLGERLIRAGRIKRSDLELAFKVIEKSRERFGKTMVEMGHVSDVELRESLVGQVHSIVCSIFPWNRGVYRSEPSNEPVDKDLVLEDMSTADIIIEGVRRIEDPGAVLKGLGDLDRVVRTVGDPSTSYQRLKLTPEEGFVLSRVDGSSTAKELARLSPLGEETTLRTLYALVLGGLLKLATKAPRKTSEAVKPRSPTPKSPAEPSTKQSGLSPEEQEFRDEVLAKYDAATDLTYYDLLGVNPSASNDEIKTGYYRLAKKLHPDHRRQERGEDDNARLDAIYLKIQEAYEVISSPARRRLYDFRLQSAAQAQASWDGRKPASADSSKGNVPTPTYSTEQMAELHFDNGKRFFKEKRYHEAVESLRDAVRLNPTRADYHHVLGTVLAKNRRWRKQAEEHLGKAISLDRFNIESYLELGSLYEESGLMSRAHRAYELALGLDPDNPRAREKLGRTSPTDSLLDKWGSKLRKKPR